MRLTVCAVVLLFNHCLALATPAKSKIRVCVRNERGQLLMSTQALQLSRGRAAVPVTAYERLGLFVRRKFKARRVDVARPRSDSGVVLYVGSRRVRDFLHEQPASTRYDTPVVVLRGKRFYANAFIMSQAFSDIFSTTWNARTHTITLQRSKRFGQLLQKLKYSS